MGRLFGWDLPPGVTQKMIDDQVAGPRLCWACAHDMHGNNQHQGYTHEDCECDCQDEDYNV